MNKKAAWTEKNLKAAMLAVIVTYHYTFKYLNIVIKIT